MQYSTTDILAAAIITALVMVGSALVLRTAIGADRRAGEASPGSVRVTPMLDLDSPPSRLGGEAGPPGRAAAALPAPRAKSTGSAPIARGQAAAPVAGPEVSGSEARGRPGDPTLDGAAGEPAGTAAVGGGADGPGSPGGAPSGAGTDALRARAADVYRERLVAWFSSRFRVSGSGLPQSALIRLSARAVVSITPDGRVGEHSMTSSGNAVFDAAVRSTLEQARGQALPPPPEDQPDLAGAEISITFVCKEGRCD